jgi:hypothetical protein
MGARTGGEAKQAIEPNPAGRSSDIPERNRVTERHITQKQSVRKDEIPLFTVAGLVDAKWVHKPGK